MVNFSQRLTDDQCSKVTRFQLTPCADVKALARSLGVEVEERVLADTTDGYLERDAFLSASGWKIVINRKRSVVRKRFTIAHELAHFLLHARDDPFYEPQRDTFSVGPEENEANLFAARILMPGRILGGFFQEGVRSPEKLGEIFGVSSEAMHRRLNELGLN